MSASDSLVAALLAGVLTAGSFLLRARTPLGTDEGYLWYGVLRVLEGDVPLRDFRSYEPGRYYWCAGVMRALRRRDVVALRAAVHLFYFVGLSAGVLALRAGGLAWESAAPAALALVVWARPGHKQFEPALLLIGALAGTLALLHPGVKSFGAAGAVAGLAAGFGVNYGLYLAAGLSSLTLLALARAPVPEPAAMAAAFAAGLAIGAVPFALLLAGVPGLFRSLHERRVRSVWARGSSNLPLPIPWPWRAVPRAFQQRLGPAGQRFAQLYFALLVAFPAAVAGWAALAPWPQIQSHAVVVSAGAIAAFGLHHALSRADLAHLSQALAAPMLGLFAVLANGPVGGRRSQCSSAGAARSPCWAATCGGDAALTRPRWPRTAEAAGCGPRRTRRG
jgi:hypothetical protein